ncbi:MAG TPA: flagellar basal-body MS-ring/collar protein FliF [Chitinivibrionales bacterium]
MSEFFKQLITQLTAIWRRLSLQQKVMTVSLIGFTFLGLISLMVWSQATPKAAGGGYRTLYSDLEVEEAAAITGELQKANVKYKVENDGRTIQVEKNKIYETRMTLARKGLPKSHGVGYEIFDKTNLGMTDFVQKVNMRRALEGELQRSIEGLEEVKSARVHIVLSEQSIFTENQQPAKASVVVRTIPGREINKEQIRGITFLVSSSVEGLKPENISIIDFNGKLLSSPYAGSEASMASSQNVELQQNVEKYLETKAQQILEEVVGPGKAKVKVAVDMDFDHAERTMEKYDPESRVIRSEERDDENLKNAPTGDAQKEKTITNYEIDKTIEHVVAEVGNIRRLTVSVAVDGKYEVPTGKNAKPVYVARTPQELQSFEDMVKNTIGYDLSRGDQISVVATQFDNEFLRKEQDDMRSRETLEQRMLIAKYAAVVIIALVFILFLRYLARTIAEAMNPPVPKLEPLGVVEEIKEEIPDHVKKTSALLERVEMLTREEPVNIAQIIRQWLAEPIPGGARKK